MNGTQGAVAPEFELMVEESAEARPVPGFHTTRTRTFFVDNFGQIYLLAAPGHRAMLQRQGELPADAEPTRDIADPDLWIMVRAAASLGRGGQEFSPLTLADYYAWRTRLFHVQAGRVFELKRDGGDHFDDQQTFSARILLGQDVADVAGVGTRTSRLDLQFFGRDDEGAMLSLGGGGADVDDAIGRGGDGPLGAWWHKDAPRLACEYAHAFADAAEILAVNLHFALAGDEDDASLAFVLHSLGDLAGREVPDVVADIFPFGRFRCD